jgi:hypothetical protein
LQETVMTLEDWANIGEIVGGVAVIISILYLAWQIRQNTKAVRATAVDSSINYSMSVRQAIFENKEITHLYHQGARDPLALTEEDLFRFRLLCHNMLLSHWNIFSQSRLADLTSETWSSQRHVVKRMLTTEGGRWFWENYRQEFEASFQVEVDAILSEP